MSAGPELRDSIDSGSGPLARRGAPTWMLPVVLLATIAALWPALRGALVWDDLELVGRNPWITSFAYLPKFFSSATWDFASSTASSDIGYWRPLTGVVLLVAHEIGGGNPLWFHALSLALHLLATAVAFRLALRLTRSAPIAFFASLLFGLHPVHVSSVAWISAINDPLFGLFALLAVDAFVAWRDRGSIGFPRTSALFFALALLSKETAAAVLPIALVLDVARQRGDANLRDRFRDTVVPAYAPFGIVLVAYYSARVAVFGDLAAGLDRVTVHFGVGASRLALLRVELLGGFIRLLAWPDRMSVFRAFQPSRDFGDPVVWIALACIAALAAVAWIAYERRAVAAACAALFVFAAISPMLLRVEMLGRFPFGERNVYLAVFGFGLLAAVVAVRALPLRVASAVLASVALVYGASSFRRTADWRNEESLFSAAIAQDPKSPFAEISLGRVLLQQYRAEKTGDVLRRAHAVYQHALDLLDAAQHGDETIFATVEDHVLANLGLGWTLLYEAEVDEYHDFKAASDVFGMVTKRYPSSAEAWTSSGVAHSQMNELADAQRDFEKALSVDPAHAEAFRGMGVLALRQGDFKKASENFAKALELRPDSLDDALSLAGALGDGGDVARAIQVAEEAREKHPADAAPLSMLGTLAAQRGDLAGAATYADRALTLAPDDGKALLLKGKLQLARQEYAGALRTFQRAADLLPTSFEAHHNAAALLLKNQSFEAAVPYLLRAYELRPVGTRGASGEVLRQTLLKMEIRDPELLAKLAAIDAQNGHDSDAEEWIVRALAVKPDHGPTHYLKGSLARKRGDLETAVAEWRQAGAAMPDNALVHESLGMLLVELKRPAEALPPLESALAIATRTPSNDENDRRAIEMLRETIERVKQDAR